MEAKGSAGFALKVGVSRRYGSSILSKPLLFVVACNLCARPVRPSHKNPLYHFYRERHPGVTLSDTSGSLTGPHREFVPGEHGSRSQRSKDLTQKEKGPGISRGL
jgi:hypothetical protein